MDRQALEHSLARRLLDHIDAGTTDLAPDILELPTDIYSTQRHAEEFDVLFRGHPLVLCLSGALPHAGTYRAVDLCGVPILLTRNDEGRVRAFANACRHRGVRVVDGGGARSRFACPFHSWTYDLDGRLVAVPVQDAFTGMCLERKGLVELPVAEGYGLIVGSLQPGPTVDIDEYLGPGLADELAVLEFADWELYGEPHVHPVGANWKVTLDTFRENYHFRFLHRRTLAKYAYGGVLTFDPFGRHLRNCSALRTIDELREVPDEQWGDVMGHISLQYALFPNTSLTFDSRHVELWQIVPVDANSSEVVHSTYLRPGLSESERAKAVEMAPWICETVVDGEDFWVAARTEPGIRAGVLDTIVFGRNEPAPQHLHRGFDDALAAARRA
ncbi:aromatic ring-hydroxylating oxygenase subunit alpha [Nocardia cerradoensis]|uniref:Terephthalate 1,2-dioxygenase, terminal oxygenase component subunit alpha 1 n=1 Tax=Nocardia cerradoensis TaxID=85688 RepID=A0A231HDV9_9NOCA|nr:aromatic ring-hydroxylating dioxygenase subunit alpha [Nocardia cerradoensis]NKY45718.1 aromatic ring-hydroxylating dioxygenase subunit alpha [Nocardia cerradoensis]OXR47049.1 Terephthalate 1,2-dioxygenase, terminal oxygenase component subunit alpha 1 [Nocardia cerradoensis]